MKTIYLVVGVPGSGKSWASRQVADKFHYIPHDRCWTIPGKPGWKVSDTWAADMKDASRWEQGAVSNHLEVLVETSKIATKPVLSECPFKEREFCEKLREQGMKVVTIFVVEHPSVVAHRYSTREGKPAPQAVLTRASSIRARAEEWQAFSGTSEEVLAHLKAIEI